MFLLGHQENVEYTFNETKTISNVTIFVAQLEFVKKKKVPLTILFRMLRNVQIRTCTGDKYAQYGAMRDALNATGYPVWFALWLVYGSQPLYLCV